MPRITVWDQLQDAWMCLLRWAEMSWEVKDQRDKYWEAIVYCFIGHSQHIKQCWIMLRSMGTAFGKRTLNEWIGNDINKYPSLAAKLPLELRLVLWMWRKVAYHYSHPVVSLSSTTELHLQRFDHFFFLSSEDHLFPLLAWTQRRNYPSFS